MMERLTQFEFKIYAGALRSYTIYKSKAFWISD